MTRISVASFAMSVGWARLGKGWVLPLPRAGTVVLAAACCVYCFILYRIYCIVLPHRVLLHIASLHIVLSVSDNGGESRQGDYHYISG